MGWVAKIFRVPDQVVCILKFFSFDGSGRFTKSPEASRNKSLLRAVSGDFGDRAFHFN